MRPFLALLFVVAGCAATPAEPERPRAVAGAFLRSGLRELKIGAGFASWIELELSRTRGEVIHDLPATDAELVLTMRYANGDEEDFEVLRNGRLHDQTRGETRRFYMALLLEEVFRQGRAPESAPVDLTEDVAAPSSATTPAELVEAVLRSPGTGAELALDAGDRLALARELHRTRPFGDPGSPADDLLVAPGWTLTVRYADGREERYASFGRVSLHDLDANRTTQFYMGLYLSDLLHAAPSDGGR